MGSVLQARDPAWRFGWLRFDEPCIEIAFCARTILLEESVSASRSPRVCGTPFAILLFWWNHRLFGNPLTFGYSAAFGPAHGLGLHTDPWGNVYGAIEALAYTGADLTQLGMHLIESPLPVIAVIGAALMIWPGRGAPVVLLWWTLAAVAASARL